MRPYLRMTALDDAASIKYRHITPGQPLMRNKVFLFGFLPMGHSDLTFTEFKEGEGFVEQSPMGLMTFWRHERRILPTANGCVIADNLTFQPRWASPIAAFFIRTLFRHRHKVLRRRLGTPPRTDSV